jgi:hypothetical protein
MKTLIVIASLLYLSAAAAGDTNGTAASAATHRYMIERTFPKGALDGLSAETKAKVNANNSTLGVHWIKSFTNTDKTKTYCLYEGPSEAAVRKAAEINSLPVDRVTEIPFDLESGAGKSKAAK